MDAFEGRDVATADITGAYLNATMPDLVLMKLTGEDIALMVDVCPEFRRFVSSEHGRKVLYLRMDRALYGCVQSALLWYKLFTDTLKGMGFELNPYDPCVANAVIDNKQCTIAWYVDDNKISHVDSKVVDRVFDAIESLFGTMVKTRGDTHEFLGMTVTFKDKTVTINMRRYLEEAIRDCKLSISKAAATPARKSLHNLDPDSALLSKEMSDSFRSIVSKLMYVGLRGCPDLLTTLCFLSKRVANPTAQDQDKLQRCLEYIYGSLELTLTLAADDLATMYIFVDVAYGVHPDCKSQTGGTVSFGTGGLISRANKQKIVTKSSTEAELVGASDYLPNTIWAQHFMEAQGYPITSSFLEQDNESAIKLEKNGRASAGQRSRHIDIRHFWIKDRLEQDPTLQLRHCDTGAMLADFLTKPLQGSLFRKFRDVLLGYQHISTLKLPAALGVGIRLQQCT